MKSHKTLSGNDKTKPVQGNEVERRVRDPQSALKVQDRESNVLLSMIHFITNEAERTVKDAGIMMPACRK